MTEQFSNGKTSENTAARLDGIIESCRAIMRKDKGLNGDLDRLPMLTWIMFLKFLDDKERIDEDRAALAGDVFRPTLEAPYRWRDWAADNAGITGDELISFINNDEAVRPDGSRGAGLFAYLRGLRSANGRDRRDVIARVFDGVLNRMISGYLLRDVLNKVNEIHFAISDELHTFSRLYEVMLREMRDAAGDSGEFYTPRPVVRFMVAATNPRLGEKILDPACGTAGFLVECYRHLTEQAETIEDRETLQDKSIFGGEAKPLPFLLAQMNLLLHGMENPQIDFGNSLGTPLRDIRDDQRVDVILTNPPFGGEEERGILSNFPTNKQTAETALLFLQLIMHKLRRKSGRAAVIVPNGTLFADGVAIRIREDLIKRFNVHTIVRLPNGVFSPYAGIPTNILFFDSEGATKGIWYYQIYLPKGKKGYSRFRPMRFEEFDAILDWWGNRQESSVAWRVDRSEIEKRNYDLDFRNPHSVEKKHDGNPVELLDSIHDKELKALKIVSHLRKSQNDTGPLTNSAWKTVCMGELLKYLDERVQLIDGEEYKTITVKRRHGGLVERETLRGSEIKTKKQFRLNPGAFIISRVQCWHQAFAIVPQDIPCNMIASSNYDQFEILPVIDSNFFWWLSQTQDFLQTVRKSAVGVIVEKMVFKRDKWLEQSIKVPNSLEDQQRIAGQMASIHEFKGLQLQILDEINILTPSLLEQMFD